MRFPLKIYLFVFLFLGILNHSNGQCGSTLSQGKYPSKAFEIVSILVDACDGSNEGQNEMIRIQVGKNPLNPSKFSVPTYVAGMVNWGTNSSNPWRGVTNLTNGTKNKILYLNNTIKNKGNCGLLIGLNTTDVIPAYSNLLFITSESFSQTAQDFSDLSDTLYVIFQKSGNTAGHFVNFGTAATRTLILTNNGVSDTVIYDRSKLLNQAGSKGADDGAVTDFDYDGSISYANYGCRVPIPPFIIDAGTVQLKGCTVSVVQLNGTVIGSKCYRWINAYPQSGSLDDSTILKPKFTVKPGYKGVVKLYLVANGNCASRKDSVQFNISFATTADFTIDSSNAPRFCFTDKSLGTIKTRWGFNHPNDIEKGPSKDFLEDPTSPFGGICYTYKTVGNRFVCMIAEGSTGCNDTLCSEIKIFLDAGKVEPIICGGNATIQLQGKKLGINKFHWTRESKDAGGFDDSTKLNAKFTVDPKYYGLTIKLYLFSDVSPLLRDSVQFIYTPKPVANFSIDSTLKPNFCFTNLSQKSNLYRWSFQGKSAGGIRIDSTVTKSNICFNYTDLGTFYVCLIAESGVLGCSDTFCGEVSYNQSIFLANVFTPGSQDGKNDEFRVPISGQEYFEIEVFNRWGTLVFQSKDPSRMWNGQVENTGDACASGTYFYLLKYKFPNQDLVSLHGSIMLIR